jgi:uncharacterized protein YecE (DUF72 family)
VTRHPGTCDFAHREIDSTFYRPPDPGTLAHWYRETPRGFRFALEAPLEITHERRLAGIV